MLWLKTKIFFVIFCLTSQLHGKHAQKSLNPNLQKLISVNPSIDFSRQFGIGRYFLLHLLSPTEKNPSFDCLGNWKTHSSRWLFSRRSDGIFCYQRVLKLKPFCVNYCLLLIIAWIIMQEFHVLLPICNRKLHSSTLSSSTRPKNAFIRFEYFVLFPTIFFQNTCASISPFVLTGCKRCAWYRYECNNWQKI